jgi:ABC-2 type transport system ATP-binding protein
MRHKTPHGSNTVKSRIFSVPGLAYVDAIFLGNLFGLNLWSWHVILRPPSRIWIFIAHDVHSDVHNSIFRIQIGYIRLMVTARRHSMAAIRTDNLTKSFRVRQPALAGVWRRTSRSADVLAVRNLSFSIEPGERVAFIGPNGAGKSTSLKMLTGILHPSSGHAEVAGFVPWRDRRKLARRIGIVFGQRSQLWWQLPVRDSFDLLGQIYGVDRPVLRDRLARLTDGFAIGDFLDRPVSQLSLGQRLRCEIAAALIHGPSILLLDEPTIGLDVTGKALLRDHLDAMSRDSGTTVLLTSHDTGDIERICERAIVIDHGTLLMDLPLERLKRDFVRHRTVTLVTGEETPAIAMAGVTRIALEPYRLTLAVDTTVVPIEQVVAAALQRLTVLDLAVENPPLEDVIKAIYRGEFSGPRAPEGGIDALRV